MDTLHDIKNYGTTLSNKIDTLVIIGIGGSYLGTKAALQMIQGQFFDNQMLKVYFLGHNMSERYLGEVFGQMLTCHSKIGVCIISKSGTTTEPMVAFRLLQDFLIAHKMKVQPEHISIITSPNKSTLYELAHQKNYKVFFIPEDIGGRYSGLTPVCLVPLAICGVDITSIIKGAIKAYYDVRSPNVSENIAYQYAAARYALYQKHHYHNELLTYYEPNFFYFSEWWKQLFSESEGKDQKALFPTACLFSTDLHSLGQYIQAGPRKILFETVLLIEKMNFKNLDRISLPADLLCASSSGNVLLDDVNRMLSQATIAAHSDADRPHLIMTLSNNSSEAVGYLFYFMMKACAISSMLLEVNPFNQPGVELYKSKFKALLKSQK